MTLELGETAFRSRCLQLRPFTEYERLTELCPLTDNDLVQIYNKKQYKPVAEFRQHPDFVGFSDLKNDIGLIKLAEPLEFGEAVQPACLGFDEVSLYDGALKVCLFVGENLFP